MWFLVSASCQAMPGSKLASDAAARFQAKLLGLEEL